MQDLHVDTPLLTSRAYAARGFSEALFKLDALQPSGSFKLRGVGRVCVEAVRDGAQEIVCASGGNAGFAAAYAGAQLGARVQVVVPETTAPEARAAIAGLGAAVTVHGASFDDADAFARTLAAQNGGAYVHPFDDPRLWAGHATLIDEVVRAGARFDVVIVSVGGGGLLLGVLEGLDRNGLSHVPVLAVETLGADGLRRSLDAGSVITLPTVTSLATSLGARRIAERAFARAREPGRVISVTVRDEDALAACLHFLDTHRVLVELASAAAIAALDLPALRARFTRPLVEVCGGVGVSLARLAAWRERLESKPA